MITTNNVLITSKAGTWGLLINYFKLHYGNESTEDDVLWDEQHNKSDTDSDEEGYEMYNDI